MAGLVKFLSHVQFNPEWAVVGKMVLNVAIE